MDVIKVSYKCEYKLKYVRHKDGETWRNAAESEPDEKQSSEVTLFQNKMSGKKNNKDKNKRVKKKSMNGGLKEETEHDFTLDDKQYANENKEAPFNIPVVKAKRAKNKRLHKSSENSVPSDDVNIISEDVKQERKSHKRKSIKSGETSPSKRIKPCEMKFKDRKLMYKKKSEKFDVVKELKTIWEDLRRGDCPKEKKAELSTKICNMIKGKVKEFAYAHDSVRVLESVISEGTEEHRSLLFEELKVDILDLTKAKYGKYFVMKMLKYGTKKQKETIMKAFHGTVIKLMKNTGASEVVETAFNECANALQRFQLVQEFYGPNYRLFKESEINSLAGLLAKQPEMKSSVISSMKEELLKVIGKSVIKHSFIHHVLLQFFLNCDPGSRSDIIESLSELVPEILHTKDGSRVAMHCVWHGNHKDRKVIIKHMKTFVKKIAMEEFGHMVLLAIFDSVDDTALIEKVIIKELQESLVEVSLNVHGRKVLVYLLNHRDPHFFSKDVINILKGGDENSISKKDPEVRQQELKKASAKLQFTKLIVDHIAELYRNNAFCLFTTIILKATVEDKNEAFKAIAKLASEPYTSENKNVHIIEYPGSHFMLKQLICRDAIEQAEETPGSVTFSEVLVTEIPDGYLKTWFLCNRGAFLLVNLIETEIPTVVNRVKQEMENCKKKLHKLTFGGAKLLLQKLKEEIVTDSIN